MFAKNISTTAEGFFLFFVLVDFLEVLEGIRLQLATGTRASADRIEFDPYNDPG